MIFVCFRFGGGYEPRIKSAIKVDIEIDIEFDIKFAFGFNIIATLNQFSWLKFSSSTKNAFRESACQRIYYVFKLNKNVIGTSCCNTNYLL